MPGYRKTKLLKKQIFIFLQLDRAEPTIDRLIEALRVRTLREQNSYADLSHAGDRSSSEFRRILSEKSDRDSRELDFNKRRQERNVETKDCRKVTGPCNAACWMWQNSSQPWILGQHCVATVSVLLAKASGCCPGDLAEYVREMALTGESEGQGDLRNRNMRLG